MCFLRSVPRDKEESIWKDDGSKDWGHLRPKMVGVENASNTYPSSEIVAKNTSNQFRLKIRMKIKKYAWVRLG